MQRLDRSPRADKFGPRIRTSLGHEASHLASVNHLELLAGSIGHDEGGRDVEKAGLAQIANEPLASAFWKGAVHVLARQGSERIGAALG